jgi:hypothetical protein
MSTTYTNSLSGSTFINTAPGVYEDIEINSMATVNLTTSDNIATLLQIGPGPANFLAVGMSDTMLKQGGGDTIFQNAGTGLLDILDARFPGFNNTNNAVIGFTAGDFFQVYGFMPGTSTVAAMAGTAPNTSLLHFTNVGGASFNVAFNVSLGTLMTDMTHATTGTAPLPFYSLPGS